MLQLEATWDPGVPHCSCPLDSVQPGEAPASPGWGGQGTQRRDVAASWEKFKEAALGMPQPGCSVLLLPSARAGHRSWAQKKIKQPWKGHKAPNPSPGLSSLLPCTVVGPGVGAAPRGHPKSSTPGIRSLCPLHQPSIPCTPSLPSRYYRDINSHIIFSRSSFFLPPKD